MKMAKTALSGFVKKIQPVVQFFYRRFHCKILTGHHCNFSGKKQGNWAGCSGRWRFAGEGEAFEKPGITVTVMVLAS